ncbi:protein of unknown function [Methylocaldum szegediense]|uniref:Transposase n=1 Tax=Methylocaldum szegediense TaxID=73780 RepID=A0ABM9HY12_9GAMM|nr:protein of unknown function [Methylocaldum szegediense]
MGVDETPLCSTNARNRVLESPRQVKATRFYLALAFSAQNAKDRLSLSGRDDVTAA